MAYDINKVLNIAEAEVGYLEKKSNSNLSSKTGNAGYNNYTKYANEIDTKYPDFYNGRKNGYDWCDIFVDWCFIKAYGVTDALKLLGQPKKSCGAGCDWSAGYFKKINRFYTSPKVGDQIFFRGSDGTPCHTGIVYKVDTNYVYTIEGNTSSASGVVANGGCVAKKKYSKSSSYIYGYGRPNYGTQKTTTTTKPSTSTSTSTTTNKTNTTSSTSELKAGTKLTLKNVALYASSSAKTKATTKTGTYYVWSKETVNNRIRITNSKTNVGKSGKVTGWIAYSTAKSSAGTTSNTSTSKSSSTSTFKPYKVKVTADIGLNIRKKPTTILSSKIGALCCGAIVTISKVSGKWGYVESKEGWICLDYTSKV